MRQMCELLEVPCDVIPLINSNGIQHFVLQHHWKGGKRKGGWKLGSKWSRAKKTGLSPANEHVTTVEAVDDIDRSTDWECCDEVIPAAKTRCGKCRKVSTVTVWSACYDYVLLGLSNLNFDLFF
jgi:hypothetical protein